MRHKFSTILKITIKTTGKIFDWNCAPLFLQCFTSATLGLRQTGASHPQRVVLKRRELFVKASKKISSLF